MFVVASFSSQQHHYYSRLMLGERSVHRLPASPSLLSNNLTFSQSAQSFAFVHKTAVCVLHLPQGIVRLRFSARSRTGFSPLCGRASVIFSLVKKD